MIKKKNLDSYHYHELLHTASVIMNLISKEIIKHPACDNDIEGYAHDAMVNLCAVYQKASDLQDEMLEEKESKIRTVRATAKSKVTRSQARKAAEK